MVRFWGSECVINMCLHCLVHFQCDHKYMTFIKDVLPDSSSSALLPKQKKCLSQFTKCCSTYLHYFIRKSFIFCLQYSCLNLGLSPCLRDFQMTVFQTSERQCLAHGLYCNAITTTFSIIPIPRSPQQISSINKNNLLLETISYLSFIEHYK